MKNLRSNKQRAKWTIILIWVALASLTILSVAAGYLITKGLNEMSERALLTILIIICIIAIIGIVTSIMGGIMFMMWFRRAYFNLHQKITGLSYKEGWAVGAWYVPIISFYRPYIIMQELYQKTGEILRINVNIALVKWWWFLFVFGMVCYLPILNTFIEVNAKSNVTYWLLCIYLFVVIYCVVSIKVIKKYSNMETLLYETNKSEGRNEDSLPKKKWKWINTMLLIGIPFCFIAIVCMEAFAAYTLNTFTNTQEYPIEKTLLVGDEYTDGRIIFKKPTDITIEEMSLEDESLGTAFRLTRENTNHEITTEITIMSVYDYTEITKEYFEEVMQAWAVEDFADFEYDIAMYDRKDINGSTYYIKKVEYQTDPYYEWTFTLISNIETGKYGIISCWNKIKESDDELNLLINSIRFQN